MRDSSGFDLKTDKSPQGEGVLALLIASALLTAVMSGGFELLNAAGFAVPHAVSLFAGLILGVCLGAFLARCLSTSKSD